MVLDVEHSCSGSQLCGSVSVSIHPALAAEERAHTSAKVFRGSALGRVAISKLASWKVLEQQSVTYKSKFAAAGVQRTRLAGYLCKLPTFRGGFTLGQAAVTTICRTVATEATGTTAGTITAGPFCTA